MKTPLKMKDIAKEAGVSPMTVSRAFNRHASVNQKTREKILRVADELGYVFDSTASSFRSQKTGFVAVTIPSLNNANFADTVTAMTEVLSRHDLQVLLGYTNYNIADEEMLIEQLLQRKPEAIVVTGGQHTERSRRILENSGIPVVEIWDIPEKPIGHVVGFSNAATIELLVGHLIDQGFSRLAYIGGEENGDTRGSDRRRGFVKALKRRGMDSTRLISAGRAPISMLEGAAATTRLLELYPDTQVVVCVSDLSAFGALSECQRKNIQVPQDIAITGFGAFDIAAFSVPAITTIDAYSSEIGAKTGELLARILKDDGANIESQVLNIEPTLVVRQSSTRS